jgi:hypothetical protein
MKGSRFAPQRRKERKEEGKKKKSRFHCKKTSFACFCLSLRPSRLCGANWNLS